MVTSERDAGAAIQLAFVVDTNNVPQLAATLAGVFGRLRSDAFAVVHVIHTSDAIPAVARLTRSIVTGGRGEVRRVEISNESLAGFPAVGFIPPIAYARLLLPDVLPDVSKVIYLDCDLLVRADLAEMWDQTLDEFSLAAAVDYAIPRLDAPNSLAYCRSELTNPIAYAFNSGVLLIDLDSWRELDVIGRSIEFVRRFHTQLYSADQDVLNFLFQGRWQRLDPRWNLPQTMLQTERRSVLDLAEFEAHRGRPVSDGVIYHFNGPLKPWNSGVSHPGRREWYGDLKRSGWFTPRQWIRWRLTEEARAIRFNIRRLVARRTNLLTPWLGMA